MKKILSLMVALIVATLSYAQNSLLATLSHGEDISMYYGSNALRDALNAAVSGDVINLSGGTFQSENITKAVTIRGAGIDDAAPTYISGFFTINIPSSETGFLTMEGIRCIGGGFSMTGTFSNPRFVKCVFSQLTFQSNSNIKNSLFANCKITDYIGFSGSSSVQFINCYVGSIGCDVGPELAFVNCVLYTTGPSIPSSQLLNCIICKQSDVWQNILPSSTIATNCVSIGFSDDIFSSQSANTGNQASSYAEMFKDYTGGLYTDDQRYELTDEAKTTFLGDDGTEVGMYGGVMPYTSTPSYPQITRMNVAKKTTTDGKLSVEIEVSAAE